MVVAYAPQEFESEKKVIVKDMRIKGGQQEVTEDNVVEAVRNALSLFRDQL